MHCLSHSVAEWCARQTDMYLAVYIVANDAIETPKWFKLHDKQEGC